MAARLDVRLKDTAAIEEAKRDVAFEAVLYEINAQQQHEEQYHHSSGSGSEDAGA